MKAKGKKLLFLVLTIVMVMGQIPYMEMPVFAAAASWADGINSTTDTWDNGGVINTAQELAQFAYNVNHAKVYTGKTITLGNDIDLSGKEWIPIGYYVSGGLSNYNFSGTFDGAGHKITGLTIGTITEPNSTLSSTGLFGLVFGEIRNLGIENITIYSSYPGGYMGGIVAVNNGSIKNCYVTGTLSNTQLSNTGGVVGVHASGALINCYSSCNLVAGNDSKVGGVAGRDSNFGAVTNVYWNGDADQSIGGVSQSKGDGGENADRTTKMTSDDMKQQQFVDTLNNNLATYNNTIFYTWKLTSNGYPTFTGERYSNLIKKITIGTAAPVRNAAIENGINPAPNGATGPVITWSDDYKSTWNASGTFTFGKTYFTKYVYTAKAGYKFDTTITGSDILATGGKVVINSVTDSSLTVTVEWLPVGFMNQVVVSPGSSTGMLKAVITGTPEDHYAVMIRQKKLDVNLSDDTLPVDVITYVSGEDIDIFTSDYPYVNGLDDYCLYLYDVDAQGKIANYYIKEIQSTDINSSSPFPGGDGTEANPYQIETAEQLRYIGFLCAKPDGEDSIPCYFKLEKDIDLGVVPYNTGKGWTPLPFIGHLDGNGKTIKNLTINATTTTDPDSLEINDYITAAGLFSFTMNATIKNLDITGAKVAGQDYVGILAGVVMETHIEQVYVTGSATGNHYIGGLIGAETASDKTVLNCYSLAQVSGSGFVGGLVGFTRKSTISTSYAAGKVSIINPSDEMEENINKLYRDLTGGVVGNAYGSSNIFHQNYYDLEVAHQSDSNGATPKDTASMKTQATFEGFDFDLVWAIDPTVNSGYPYLRCLKPQQDATPTPTASPTPTAVPTTVPTATQSPTTAPIDTTGSSNTKTGEIIKDQQQDKSLPETNLNSTTKDLKSAVFTTEELTKIEAGEDAKVILKVTDVSNSVSESEKKLIEKNLEEGVTAMYIDLSLYKKIGNGTETKITETKDKISISIEIPENLRTADMDKNRKYQIVRIHDGVATIIDGTYDPVTHLFTFETDRFSTYVLTYEDESADFDSNVENGSGTTKTFAPLFLTAIATATSQKLTYTAVPEADGYLIFGAACSVSNRMSKLADVTGKITSYVNKGLKGGTYYKYMVQAYQIVDGKKVILATSKVIHSVTTGKTYANPTQVTTSTLEVKLAVGASKKISGKLVLPKGKTMQSHTNKVLYETTNQSVATVTADGKVKAVSKGTCYIYVYAQNGVYTKIKVIVK